MRIKSRITFIIFTIAFAFNLSAQSTTPAPEVKEEQEEKVQLSAEEKKAIIDEKRAVEKKRRQRYNAHQNQKSVESDEEMYVFLELNEKQIAKYKKISEANRKKTLKAMEKVKSDPAGVGSKIQEIRNEEKAQLKKLFTPAQMDKYFEFKELKASKNKRSKRNNVVKKID